MKVFTFAFGMYEENAVGGAGGSDAMFLPGATIHKGFSGEFKLYLLL